ncbi:MAG: amidohydrolase family protein [Candidatus Aegiribacteria sp.]|nr:amidohydrolase family protein [Candidatus Aegiribacteria sp.]
MSSIVCGAAWTGPNDRLLPASLIEFSEGRITGISSAPDTESNLFIIPAFVDAHCHFTWSGLQGLYLDLESAGSSGDFLEMLASEVKDEKTGGILRGCNFDESLWSDSGLPSLAELDAVTGERPIFIRRVCCHKALVNTAMLKMLPSGCEGVDWSSGVIREGIIVGFENLYQPEPQILREAALLAAKLCYSSGVTAVYSFEHLFSIEALARNKPTVRMSVSVFGEDSEILEKAMKDESIDLSRLRGLKFFLDGSLGAKTAAVSGTYIDGTVMNPLMNDEQVLECLLLSDRLGLTPSFHAIGARALTQIDRTGTLYFEKTGLNGIQEIRVEHAEELLPAWPGNWDPSMYSFIMQPNFVKRWQQGGGLYEKALGRERALKLNPFGLLERSGFSLGFSSDGMPFGPLRGLQGATDHPSDEFRLDIDTALNAYTLGAASVCGFDDLSLRLGKGRIADITVLSDNPFRTAWDDIHVVATFQNGELVYGSSDILEEI